jgi:hypothetical protein
MERYVAGKEHGAACQQEGALRHMHFKKWEREKAKNVKYIDHKRGFN